MNQGAKVEWKVKVEGEKPITVNWLKNGSKMKASRNIKLNYIARTGEVGTYQRSAGTGEVGTQLHRAYWRGRYLPT